MHAQVATECLLWLANWLPGIDQIYTSTAIAIATATAVARCPEDIA